MEFIIFYKMEDILVVETNKMSVQHLFPEYFETYSPEIQTYIIDYLCQLTNLEKKACMIAKRNLESSYDILKSNGYIEYMNNK